MPKTASEGMERKKNAADDTVCQNPPTAKTYSPSPLRLLELSGKQYKYIIQQIIRI
ncbi:hypothetical protein HMPREF9303_2681 [Prevotella denticola CRIS 18C-A]|uniref:Uncharacterized protein n=1 Tax=Prevotella denticola CRIS 18C-A TaxID=944557 RepID=F0H929_9BACT|nr:hypothetical protein HMPREF9303_2681 [Prevotella denticola CRIS 18C-A]